MEQLLRLSGASSQVKDKLRELAERHLDSNPNSAKQSLLVDAWCPPIRHLWWSMNINMNHKNGGYNMFYAVK